jgi:prepilin-type N-terminal cleavage/methylation domain-containing protein
MHRLLKRRAGFTLVELMVTMVLTAVIGAAITGVFVTQARFFDLQEKVAFARGVSRGGMNMILAELRMLETGGGIIEATNRRLLVRAPYAMGIVCGNQGQLTISRLPVDSVALTNAGFAGFAYRAADGTFTYVETNNEPARDQGLSVCLNNSITVMVGATVNQTGRVEQFPSVPTPAPAIGAPIFLYQKVVYHFKESAAVPGQIGLWRRVESADEPVDEELVAPFDTTAKFRFYVDDSPAAQTDVPALLSSVTGIELTLDGLSERPERDGSRQSVPLTTSVFFKNRP